MYVAVGLLYQYKADFPTQAVLHVALKQSNLVQQEWQENIGTLSDQDEGCAWITSLNTYKSWSSVVGNKILQVSYEQSEEDYATMARIFEADLRSSDINLIWGFGSSKLLFPDNSPRRAPIVQLGQSLLHQLIARDPTYAKILENYWTQADTALGGNESNVSWMSPTADPKAVLDRLAYVLRSPLGINTAIMLFGFTDEEHISIIDQWSTFAQCYSLHKDHSRRKEEMPLGYTVLSIGGSSEKSLHLDENWATHIINRSIELEGW
jgi:hypothetical protein